MNDTGQQRLRQQIILLVVSLVVAIGGIAGGFYYRDEMDTQEAEGQHRLQSLFDQKRAQEAQTQQSSLYKSRFEAYQAIGVFDPEEPRWRWVEQLLAVEKGLHLPVPLHFKLDVRQPFTSSIPTLKRVDGLFSSRMEVTMGLLHEGDLLDFFQQLANHGYGVYDVRSCRVERLHTLADAQEDLEMEPHLQAICHLNGYWYDLTRTRGKGAL